MTLVVREPSESITDYVFYEGDIEFAIEHFPHANPAIQLCCDKCDSTVPVEIEQLMRVTLSLLRATGNSELAAAIHADLRSFGLAPS